MSEYQVIARKWRPQRFSDVVGQEHLTRTLRNAIVQNRTAHAYLLVGPRGIGKTTTARILAKALNCKAPEDGEPCCKCDSCVAMAEGSSLDIIEIDAASQNSVDDVRSLRDQVMFSPVNSKYKIYIVDEVHMLTKQAWNAFLKTLEEPPPHVKFIFATTEVHKVLPTIISRCQRFDLRPIPTALIVKHLASIAATEKIPVSNAALEAIARAAEGGMRDAQSLLDQVITYFSAAATDGATIDESQIFALFGLTSPEEMDTLIRSVLADDRPGVIRALHAFASLGRNLETLLEELTEQLRAIMITLTVKDAAAILESGPERLESYRALGKGLPPGRIQTLLENLASAGYGLRNALNKQVYLETALLKAMREAYMVRLDDVIARLNEVRETGELKPLQEIPIAPFAQLPVTPSNRDNAPLPPAVLPMVPVVEPVIAPEPVAVPTPAPAPEPEPVVEEEPVEPDQPKDPDPAPVPMVAESESPPVPVSTEPLQRPKSIADLLSALPRTAEPPKSVSFFDAPTAPAPTSAPVAEEPIESGATEPQGWPFSEEPSATTSDPDPVEVISPEMAETIVVEPPKAEPIPEPPPVGESGIWRESRPAPSQPIEPPMDTQSPAGLWDATIKDVREKLALPMLADAMLTATPESIEGDTLRITFDEEYGKENSDAVLNHLEPLENTLRRLSNHRINGLKLSFKAGVASLEEHRRHDAMNPPEIHAKVEHNPYVQRVLKLFDGDIADVH